MKTNRSFLMHLAGLLALVAALAMPRMADAQITNWVAYNDHRPSAAVAGEWPKTAPNVTGYDMGTADIAASALTDFRTGNSLTATVSFTRTGTPDDFGTVGPLIRTNTPMAGIFYGICNLQNAGVIGVRATTAVPANATESYVSIMFGGLDPTKRYVFRGAGVRNGGYGTRWSVAAISADGFTDAHINGAGGPGVLTVNSINIPAGALSPGQAAWNSGANNEGAVVGWNDIVPLSDGTFTITVKQYTGAIPGGTATGSAQYGYSFGAIALTEVEIVAPAITANPTASTTVEQNRPFSLSVAATGAPLNYQWYREGVGAVSGATFATYSVGQAQVGDSGRYYAVVYNSLARRTSTVAQVTVFADTTAPTVDTVFSYPTVDAGGVATLNQIIIEFNEPVTSGSVSSPASYTVPGGGNPVSVIVTNERSVVLMLGTPLAEDTDYSVTLSGAKDAVGNVAGSSSAPFHSWVRVAGNGLLMESYPAEDPAATVESLFTDSDYPNNPDRRDTLRAFDTRLVYPDDTRDAYGARIRGVFIPPVSGDWRFFVRMAVLGVLYINPNGTDAAGKVEIVRQSTQNPPYTWDRLQSSLVSLRAGRAYYIEGVYKNATGADFFKVAARLAGTGTPTPVDSPDTDAPDANSLAGAIIAYPLAPRDLGGVLTIAQDVGDVTAEDNHDATFYVLVNNPSGLPLFYQWFRDGSSTPIAGANGPAYTFQAAAADHNATFNVTVSKVGAQVASRTARLTVVPDITGPKVVEAISPNLNDIIVRYSERVKEGLSDGSAEDNFAYFLVVSGSATRIGVSTAVLQADRSAANLTPEETLVAGTTYELTVSGVKDLGGLFIDPDPTVVTFLAGSAGHLSIRHSGSQAVLSWLNSGIVFTLEQTDALANPGSATVWTAVGITPTVVNGLNNVSVAAGPGAKQFFRLRQ